MLHDTNPLGQPLGQALPNWQPPPHPPRRILEGRYCRLEPLDPDLHAEALFAANGLDDEGRNWTYLPYGPFANLAVYRAWVARVSEGEDPLFFAIVEEATGLAAGVASYLRITPGSGSIEVGHRNYSPLLQRTRAATEAMYLMMEQAFALGYRRYEWKCNAFNAASREGALRLGFSYEGLFRQATVVKGHNRDTAWYAVIDREWPALQAAFLQWLDPANFDSQDQQRVSLSALTAPLLVQRG